MNLAISPLKPSRRWRLQEGGLLVVIFVLGALLTLFGGRVPMSELKKNAAGEVERVMVEKNKFLKDRKSVV